MGDFSVRISADIFKATQFSIEAEWKDFIGGPVLVRIKGRGASLAAIRSCGLPAIMVREGKENVILASIEALQVQQFRTENERLLATVGSIEKIVRALRGQAVPANATNT